MESDKRNIRETEVDGKWRSKAANREKNNSEGNAAVKELVCLTSV